MKKTLLALFMFTIIVFSGTRLCMAETYSGTCGENLTWVLDEEGTLTISGSGDFSPLGANWDNITPSSVNSVQFTADISLIPYGAFQNFSSLISIDIPDSVTTIGYFAFFGCNSLTSINIPNNVTVINDYVFSGCSSLISITIPDSVTSIGNRAFNGCSSLTSITIPNSVTSIGDSAFSGCSSLTSITIPDSVTSIGDSAFSGCSSLTSITIPDSVTSIGGSAFYNCSSLTSITIPDSVTNIEDYAFYGCSKLSNIEIPYSVKSIGMQALYTANNIVIWSSQISLGENAFKETATIYCYEYSDADYWATDQGNSIVYLDNFDIDTIRKINIPETLRIACETTQTVPITIFPCQDNPEIRWYSTDNSVVSINSGIIYANKPGTAIVSVTVGNVTASMNVSTYVMVEDFDLPHELWIITKNTSQLSISNVTPEGAEADITWSSSDKAIATVDLTGLLTAKKPGDAIITATDGSGLSKETTVHVCYPVTAIEIQPVDTLYIGQALQLTANVTMRTQSCVNHLVTFTSSDETIASVDENGLVTALSAGTVEITAAAESGISASCSIIVNGFEAVLDLPADLREINSEAFADLASVEAVRIPGTVTSISDDAFSGSIITIIAPAGSYAIQWAEDHGIPYVEE